MLNAAIKDIPLPCRMARLPVNERGFPVPFFVAKVGNDWDFRAFDGAKFFACYRRRLCWLCGEPLGRYVAFVIGPMCSVNRVSSEPPSHLECAQYAVRACPFLTRPRARRNEVDMPDGKTAGISLEHNPGATLIWITKAYHAFKDGKGGVLFQIGEPHDLLWFAEGRTATRAEIEAAFDKGLPFLREVAAKEGGDAEQALQDQINRALKLLPA
jgi:uncharacterized protein (DUF3820 family)